MVKTDFESGRTARYVPQEGVGALLHISRNHVARMEKTGLLPTADVWVAKYLRGWEPERILTFGREAEIIDATGNHLHGPAKTRALKATTAALVSEHYSQPTRMYLGTSLIGKLLRLDSFSVYTVRYREQWEAADVQVGTRFGWDEERVIRFGKQTGRIDEARVDQWMVERTAEHGLDPRTDWVLKRVRNRPATDEAVKAYRIAAKNANPPRA